MYKSLSLSASISPHVSVVMHVRVVLWQLIYIRNNSTREAIAIILHKVRNSVPKTRFLKITLSCCGLKAGISWVQGSNESPASVSRELGSEPHQSR